MPSSYLSHDGSQPQATVNSDQVTRERPQVQQYNRPCAHETRNCHEPYDRGRLNRCAAAFPPVYEPRGELRLVADKVNMWGCFQYEWVLVVEGVAGQSVRCGGGEVAELQGALHQIQPAHTRQVAEKDAGQGPGREAQW